VGATIVKFEFLRLNHEECPDDEAPERFGFECPRHPGRMCSGLLISGKVMPDGSVADKETKSKHTWAWNGDRAAPTFKPSINCQAHNPKKPAEKYAGCGWHGYITNGVIK
jgi:hypothetical protein